MKESDNGKEKPRWDIEASAGIMYPLCLSGSLSPRVYHQTETEPDISYKGLIEITTVTVIFLESIRDRKSVV